MCDASDFRLSLRVPAAYLTERLREERRPFRASEVDASAVLTAVELVANSSPPIVEQGLVDDVRLRRVLFAVGSFLMSPNNTGS